MRETDLFPVLHFPLEFLKDANAFVCTLGEGGGAVVILIGAYLGLKTSSSDSPEYTFVLEMKAPLLRCYVTVTEVGICEIYNIED